jgi:para-aminobenzoate synthetase/4-amino-4-deoxychorismate lyase
VTAPRAAFDIPADPRDRTGPRLRGAFTGPPAETLLATRVTDVPRVVARAEALARAGAWVVGGVRYEGGGAWDGAQVTHPPSAPPAHFEAFAGPPEPWPDTVAPAPLDWRDDDAFGARAPMTADAAIAAVAEHIAAGDCYQVNLTTRLRADAGVDLFELFAALATAQPGGWAIHSAAAGVASVSPELFFRFGPDGTVITQPMKGTAPREAPPETLRSSEKDRAENLMIVDLLRNDLSRVCDPGSVRVEGLFELVALPTVWQLVSTVVGEARTGVGLADVMGALFPCGSVTGAPKVRAMEVIAGLERRPRGWYCGALGVIRPGGEAVFNVPIRTVERDGDTLVCGVGSGIVADSTAVAERREWRAKQAFLGGRSPEALETMLLADGRIVRRERHLARLARTCAAFSLPLDGVDRLLAEAAATHPRGRHRLRLTVGHDGAALETRPAPATPLPVRLALAARPLDPTGFLRPVLVHKTTHRAHWHALRAGAAPDAFDVISHTPAGALTECTTGNLALRIGGEWVTPAAGVGLLPGVLREELLEAGRLREADLTVADLGRATELAFLNSLRGWCPAVLARSAATPPQ